MAAIQNISYAYSFVGALGMILGFIVGALLVIYAIRGAEIFRMRRRRRMKRRAERKRRKKEQMAKREPAQEENRGSKDAEISLKDRMVNKTDTSWSDFNCLADGVDEKELVKKNRRKQDKSYGYIKNKRSKSGS